MTNEATNFLMEAMHKRSINKWIIIDTHYIVRYVNYAFCQWIEKQSEDIVGRSAYELFYKEKQLLLSGEWLSPIIETFEENKELSMVECHLSISKKQGWCSCTTYLQRDEIGCPLYAAACYIPINRYKAIEEKLDHMSISVIKSFAKAIDARDRYTGTHSEHVGKLMLDFAEALQLSQEQINLAYLSGIVHDIGKIGIPESVLNKPSRLLDSEFALIKQHPQIGANILSGISGFEIIADAVRHHHERYDGKGYPYGLEGQQIPKLSQMLSLCDSYDAMTTTRCYRKPFTTERALSEIKEVSGVQFETEMSRNFIDFIQESEYIKEVNKKGYDLS